MIRLILVCIVLCSWSFPGFAQNGVLSPEAEISVLTIGPGTLLNDSFGHSGFRVNDPTSGLDLVFNYGVYDFDTPDFYLKFAQGKLNYKIGVNYFSDFEAAYRAQNRSIREQVLNLSNAEKQRLYGALLENMKPANRYYLYDFFYDNCATRIEKVLSENMLGALNLTPPDDLQPKSFRTLIQDELHYNSWGSVGIDMALGSVIDKTATPREYMFLPKFIYAFFENGTIEGRGKLVAEDRVLFEGQDEWPKDNGIMSPLVLLSILALIIVLITLYDFKKQRRSKWLDALLFGFTGLLGLFMLLLWFATDHTATAFNYNMLWAFPINIFGIIQAMRKTPKNWFRKYIKFLLIAFALLLLHWTIGVQVFAIALAPLLLALVLRYVYLVMHLKPA